MERSDQSIPEDLGKAIARLTALPGGEPRHPLDDCFPSRVRGDRLDAVE